MQKKRKFGSASQKTAFKPRTKDDNFLLAVIMTTGKMLMLTVLILCIAGGGLLVGVAKAWVETMPILDLSKFDEKAQTSFFYDKNGDLITSYRSTEYFCTRLAAKLIRTVRTIRMAAMAKATPNSPCSFA